MPKIRSWDKRHTPLATKVPRPLYTAFSAACKAKGMSQTSVIIPAVRAVVLEVWGEDGLEKVDQLTEEQHKMAIEQGEARKKAYHDSVKGKKKPRL